MTENNDNNDNDSKWVVIDTDKKYRDLIYEIEVLKSIVLDLHTTIKIQSEGFDSLDSKIELIRDKTMKINNELTYMKESKINSTRYEYIKDYIVPLIGIVGVNYPIFLAMGPKVGMMISSLSYLIWKLN